MSSDQDIMTLNFYQLHELHRANYVKRYPNAASRNCDGRSWQQTGSTPLQWKSHWKGEFTAEARELYAAGYKPADARKELDRRKQP